MAKTSEERMEAIDNHRRELLNEDFETTRHGQAFISTSKELIIDVLINDRDQSRFTEEDMLRDLSRFLRKQKGITQLANGVYEIRGPLT